MTTVVFDDVPITMPLPPYEQQVKIMECVVRAIKTKSNALLESPTGTGKTLALLCAVNATMKSIKTTEPSASASNSRGIEEDPTVLKGFDSLPIPPPMSSNTMRAIYTSRTHSQITQVVRELRKTVYRPRLAVLCSREQTCLHQEIKHLKGSAQNAACNRLVSVRGCKHYNSLKANPQLALAATSMVMDIEDLVKFGESQHICPYFLSREMQAESELTLMPYNYLTDAHVRSSMKNLNDSIVIFDEAHNLESACSDAASFDLSSRLIAVAIGEVHRCITFVSMYKGSEDLAGIAPGAAAGGEAAPAVEMPTEEELSLLKCLLLSLEKTVDKLAIPKEGLTMPGSYIFDLLGEVAIKRENLDLLLGVIDKALVVLADARNSLVQAGQSNGLATVSSGLKTVFAAASHANEFYRVHVFKDDKAAGTASSRVDFATPKANSWVVGFWCFSPGVAMRSILQSGVRCVILTSGTLSPMDSWAQEMQTTFPIQLENSHVISHSQAWVGVISKGPAGTALNSSYRHRDSLTYKNELGNLLVNISRVVPDGLLVFFPSYGALSACVEAWKVPSQNGGAAIMPRLERMKPVFTETKNADDFLAAVSGYIRAVDQGKGVGAIFLAVCRGKLSEGIDFADRHGRCVVITGLPFPCHTEPRVALKRDFLDETNKKGKGRLTGSQWYTQQAARAVNQALGRVIRHISDYGAILLCDERFEPWVSQKLFSSWVRQSCRIQSSFGEAMFSLTKFFQHHAASTNSQHRIAGEEESMAPKQIPRSTPIDISALIKEKNIHSSTAAATSAAAEASKRSTPACSLLEALHSEEKNEEILSSISNVVQRQSLSERLQAKSAKAMPAKPNSTVAIPSSSVPVISNLPFKRTLVSVDTAVISADAIPNNPPKQMVSRETGSDSSTQLQQFLEKVKQKLSKEEFAIFRSLMMQFRQQDRTQESFSQLYTKASDIFFSEDRRPFLRTFISFFPHRFREEYLTKMSEKDRSENHPSKLQRIK